jgi:pimeloyl-ACP methyl ester carboxylesterase
MEHLRLNVGEVTLHAVSEGSGPPVLLLHGFPEFWYSWRRQLPALAAAGFRAIAPDLRGYNESDRPEGARHYSLQALAQDVVGLVRALGVPKVHLVGHDWGGAIAWALAHTQPGIIDRLAILNCPHPALMRRQALTSWEQLKRVWYFFFFQLPWVPERMLLDRRFVGRALRGYSTRKERAFSDEDLARYDEALRKPGAATAALDYYRAMWRSMLAPLPGRVRAPTLVLWGDRDPVLRLELLDGLHRHVEDLRVEHLPEASHWVQHDEPERVNELLIEHFRQK